MHSNENTLLPDFNMVEFHRNGLALVSDPLDQMPGVAFFIKGENSHKDQRFCTCSTSKKKTCHHILKLTELHKSIQKQLNGKTLEEDFKASIWHKLATLLADGPSETLKSVSIHFTSSKDEKILKVLSSEGKDMLHYISDGPDLPRFIERIDRVEKTSVPNRSVLLDKLSTFTASKNESVMEKMGFKTRRQVLEESFWFRLAYHGYREIGTDNCIFYPTIDESSGTFTITCKGLKGERIFTILVPRKRVENIILAFKDYLPNQHGMNIHPIPLKSLLKVSMNTKLDLEVRPIIQLLQKNGEALFFERKDLEKFQYDNLIYIKELKIIAELEQPGDKKRKFVSPVNMVLKKSQIPNFLQEFGEELFKGGHIIESSVKNLKIFKKFDKIEITPGAIDRDWLWLSMEYGFGNISISLEKILQAKKIGQRYISTPDGWVDCQSTYFNPLNKIVKNFNEKGAPGTVGKGIKLSLLDFLHFQNTNTVPLNISGEEKKAHTLRKILHGKPSHRLPSLKGMKSSLRPYQMIGLDWLYFLCENRLGGLLCDDMGLGKTHQIMALMLALRENNNVESPFLVVCPTTVLSHWLEKLRDHAPGLKVSVFHGDQRNLEKSIDEGNVVLTSYGILRNDIQKLKCLSFSFVVFDEIQYLKNPATHAYNAAKKLNSSIKIGLTGTPIENTLWELKSLLDLTVPGYLGSNDDFSSRYVQPLESTPSGPEQKALSKLISPFTLRRLKKTVLDELPDKIEDIRTCQLSDDQVKLYRDAVSSRGYGLIDSLKNNKKPVPYMHVFALLNLLKQICNHPAQVKGVDDFEQFQSGKWELFKELIFESLDSDLKIVVYSQYLKMIKIIEKYLQGINVDFATLTGSSRNRGEIINRFKEDTNCKIFLGSLKAGGIGIDLVSASVVIHYDRWWNAAKEDQATDRVHRIGQVRGVQVFKLVTLGTLEEKISAIIEKKRNLMDSVVLENKQNLLKFFSREELIEMLNLPSSQGF